jgi:hypothetical protein
MNVKQNSIVSFISSHLMGIIHQIAAFYVGPLE